MKYSDCHHKDLLSQRQDYAEKRLLEQSEKLDSMEKSMDSLKMFFLNELKKLEEKIVNMEKNLINMEKNISIKINIMLYSTLVSIIYFLAGKLWEKVF